MATVKKGKPDLRKKGDLLWAHPALTTDRKQGWIARRQAILCGLALAVIRPPGAASPGGAPVPQAASTPAALALACGVCKTPAAYAVVCAAPSSHGQLWIPRWASCSGCRDTVLTSLACAACSPAGSDHPPEEALEEKGRHLHLL